MEKDTINVLLIDDEAEYAKIAQHLLSRFQGKTFNLIWKQDGEAGITELKSNPAIDIVLMDYFLPVHNGIEIVKQLAEQNINVPVILLTAHRNFQVAVEAMRHGVYDYLVKDQCSDTVLPKAILTVLDHVRIHKQITEIEKQQMLAQKRTEAIQELIVTICHEFNNPLAAIKISIDIISRQQLTPQEHAYRDEFMQKLSIVEKEIAKLRNIHWAIDAASGQSAGEKQEAS